MKHKMCVIFLSALMVTTLSISTAKAHRVIAFASFDGENVTVEGYFPGGDAIKNSEVKVVDSNKEVVAIGKTDEKGFFSFRPHGNPPFTIFIKAGPGHLAKTVISPEVFNEPINKKEEKIQDVTSNRTSDENEQDKNHGQIRPPCDLSRILVAIQAIRQDIDELRKEQEKVRMNDIIGGIGYIFGVLGILALIKSRRNGT